DSVSANGSMIMSANSVLVNLLSSQTNSVCHCILHAGQKSEQRSNRNSCSVVWRKNGLVSGGASAGFKQCLTDFW
ncbi:hypothetical protein ACWJ3O_27475, partial [Klebsiella pneumoniae]